MDDRQRLARLANICEIVFGLLEKNGLHRSCIDGSALLLKVLHGTGFPDAFPLTVGVSIFNAATLEYLKSHPMPSDEAEMETFNDAGCVHIGVGTGGGLTVDGEEGWDGHLVVVVPNAGDGKHWIVDLTLVQVDIPEWNVNIKPMLLRVRDAFVTEQSSSPFERNGLYMIYHPRPNDRSYCEDGSLLGIPWVEPAAAQVIDGIRQLGIV
jgi:hypothetical protein